MPLTPLRSYVLEATALAMQSWMIGLIQQQLQLVFHQPYPCKFWLTPSQATALHAPHSVVVSICWMSPDTIAPRMIAAP